MSQIVKMVSALAVVLPRIFSILLLFMLNSALAQQSKCNLFLLLFN